MKQQHWSEESQFAHTHGIRGWEKGEVKSEWDSSKETRFSCQKTQECDIIGERKRKRKKAW